MLDDVLLCLLHRPLVSPAPDRQMGNDLPVRLAIRDICGPSFPELRDQAPAVGRTRIEPENPGKPPGTPKGDSQWRSLSADRGEVAVYPRTHPRLGDERVQNRNVGRHSLPRRGVLPPFHELIDLGYEQDECGITRG